MYACTYKQRHMYDPHVIKGTFTKTHTHKNVMYTDFESLSVGSRLLGDYNNGPFNSDTLIHYTKVNMLEFLQVCLSVDTSGYA